uniref:Cytochrome P450 n=1 Tax=Bracon brevicornis TaxID=1563983 RepID=A0A6V7I791_9HYME
MAELIKEYHLNFPGKSMVGLYVMQDPLLLIRDPDLVKTIVQTDFTSFRHHHATNYEIDPLLDQNPFFSNDDKWKNARKVVLSMMTLKKLKDVSLIIVDNAQKFIKHLDEKIKGEDYIELEGKDTFRRVTVAIAANAVLSLEEGMFGQNSSHLFKEMMKDVFASSTTKAIKFSVFFFLPALNSIFKSGFVPNKVNKKFASIVNNLLEERQNGDTRRDLFQHLIEYCKDKDMSKASIISNTFMFFMESYETSALTLSFLAYDMAAHPEIQEKLREHINEVIEKNGNEISYESINEMTYLEKVLQESMRFHPVAGHLRKFCSQATELMGSDGLHVKLKPGDQVMCSMDGIHRDPSLWKNPEEFRPERFDKDSEEFQQRHNYAYIPFGEGPRTCPGKRFGTLIVRLIIVTLLREYSIEKSPKLKEPVTLDPKNFLSSIEGGAWLRLRKLS